MINKYLAILLSLLILTTSVSAYTYYYPRHSDYGSNFLSYLGNNEVKSSTYIEEKESRIISIPGGTKKITTTHIEETTTKQNLPYYEDYYSNYYPNMYDSRVYPSNWRFKEPFNTYTTPYYYQPRYDTYLGYYNWRY